MTNNNSSQLTHKNHNEAGQAMQATHNAANGRTTGRAGQPAKRGLRILLAMLMLTGAAQAWAAVTTSTTLATSANPSVVGTSVTLTATVVDATPNGRILAHAPAPSGTVTFMDGASPIGTGTLSASGVATLNYTFTAAGTHTLTTVYGGNTRFAASTSAATSQTVNKAPTTTSLTATPNPSTVGNAVTLSVTVTGYNPSGTVTFYDGTTAIGTGTVNAGTATLSYTFTSAGNHSLTASYAGDANNLTSVSAATSQTVNKAATTTSLTATPSPSTVGNAVTLSVTVSGYNPSGTVTFMDGTTAIGTGTLSNGTATLSYTFTTTGAHSLTAAYGGDANNNASTSAAVSQTVNSGVLHMYYIQSDQLDSPRSITNTAGQVVWQWDNTDPFGNNVPNENPSNLGQFSFNLRFPGQYADRETNTYYNVNRDYDPATGRYVESDPIGLLAGINTYAYVGGSPILRIDADGLGGAVRGGVVEAPGYDRDLDEAMQNIGEPSNDEKLSIALCTITMSEDFCELQKATVINKKKQAAEQRSCRYICPLSGNPTMCPIPPKNTTITPVQDPRLDTKIIETCYLVCEKGPFLTAPAPEKK